MMHKKYPQLKKEMIMQNINARSERVGEPLFGGVLFEKRKVALEEAASSQKMFWELMGRDKRRTVLAEGVRWNSSCKVPGMAGPTLRMSFYLAEEREKVEIKVMSDGRWQMRENGNYENWGFGRLAELLVDGLLKGGKS